MDNFTEISSFEMDNQNRYDTVSVFKNHNLKTNI